MTYTIAVSSDSMFVALQAWIMDALGLDINHVVRELNNGVPMPTDPFVCMSHISGNDLSTVVSTYSYPQGETLTKSTDYIVQIDCYGPSSKDWSDILSTVFRSHYGYDFLNPYGVTPLYNENPHEIPFVDSESIYEERWSTRLHLQFNPTVYAAMQSMTAVQITPINVDTLPR